MGKSRTLHCSSRACWSHQKGANGRCQASALVSSTTTAFSRRTLLARGKSLVSKAMEQRDTRISDRCAKLIIGVEVPESRKNIASGCRSADLDGEHQSWMVPAGRKVLTSSQ
ncbi:hypothetical protein BTVI_127741 [Pitangus sulphuratus]|nr:hypothetical protein BTVI_127741 [Pitangus sulphuratus]